MSEDIRRAVERARVVDAITQPHEANSLLSELADAVAYLASVVDDLTYKMPTGRSEAPTW